MTSKVFVANFPWETKENELKEAFAKFGEVEKVEIIMKKEDPTQSRGFGFVTFCNSESADLAIGQLDGTTFNGRRIAVKEEEVKKNFNSRKSFNTDQYQ